MGQFSDPVAAHPRTNEVEVPPPPGSEARIQMRKVPDRLWIITLM